jgi:hypothetical protein
MRKEGGIWHGYHADFPQVDERGLTEEIARRKVERIVERGTAKNGTQLKRAVRMA